MRKSSDDQSELFCIDGSDPVGELPARENTRTNMPKATANPCHPAAGGTMVTTTLILGICV